MNFEIREATPEIRKTHDIVVDGEIVGSLRPGVYSRWQASIWLENSRFTGRFDIFGFAETQEEAVLAAMEDGRRKQAALAGRLAELESRLGVAEAAV